MRPSGIEPEAIAWEAMILPLNQERYDSGEKSGNTNLKKNFKAARGPEKLSLAPRSTSSL